MKKEKRYKIIIDISRKLVQANIFKSYFQKTLSRYENKLERLVGEKRDEAVYQRFYDVNSKYWEEIEHDKKAGTILVEGFFGESGPNYVIRVGTIAKALEKITKAAPLVILRCGLKTEPFKKPIWSSFKMNDIIGVNEDIIPHLSKLRIKMLTGFYFLIAKFFVFTKQYDKFINLSYQNVQFGDMLYDEITKIDAKKTHTIKSIDRSDYKLFEAVFEGFLYSEYLWKNYDIKYYVTTHSQYVAYGLPTRFFYMKGIPVIETTDAFLFFHDKNKGGNVPKFHDNIRRMVEQNIKNIYDNQELISTAAKRLESRFSGQDEQIDVKMAYENKTTYSYDALKEKLNIKNENPIVYIFAHIFSDAPCGLSDFRLFPDYFRWLDETVKYCSKINNVNWVIKEHPSVDAYGERGEVAKVVEKYTTKDSTIFVCPDDFSTASLKETAHAIITAQGTVGLEYSCVGIPVVITAAPFYKGFGFTLEPQTPNDYFEILKNISKQTPPSEDQKRMALAVYESFQRLNNDDFSLVDTKLKDLTWGCGVQQDVLGAFDLMSDRLEKIDPKTRPLYSQIFQRFE